MGDRHYDSESGEFVDFETLAYWQEIDKNKTAKIATLEGENYRLREALERIATNARALRRIKANENARQFGVIARKALEGSE